MNKQICLTFEDLIAIMSQITSIQDKYDISDKDIFQTEIKISISNVIMELDIKVPAHIVKNYPKMM